MEKNKIMIDKLKEIRRQLFFTKLNGSIDGDVRLKRKTRPISKFIGLIKGGKWQE